VTQLTDLTRGQSGRVVEIQGADELALRLMEMGLTPGVEVTLIGQAPLGDPLEFDVRGYRLSLRKQEADLVRIEAGED